MKFLMNVLMKKNVMKIDYCNRCVEIKSKDPKLIKVIDGHMKMMVLKKILL